MPPSSPSLAPLDSAPPAALDPKYWKRNLAALHGADGELTDAIAGARIPSHWRAAQALDGAPHWRIEPPGKSAEWLANTAAPSMRAAEIVAAAPSLHNHLLSGTGTGYEIRRLLSGLACWQAVIVLVDDPAALAAVLHIHEFARDIASRRLLFIRGGQEPGDIHCLADAIESRLGALLAPTVLHRLPGCADERWSAIEAAGRAVAQRRHEARDARLRKARQCLGNRRPTGDETRIAVFAIPPWTRGAPQAQELSAAAGAAGLAAKASIADSPASADSTFHAACSAEFRPSVSIFAGCAPASLGASLPGIVCRWHFHAGDVPASPEAAPVIHLAASPRVAAALRERGVPAERLRMLPWSVPEQRRVATLAPATSDAPLAFALVADLPDDGNAACGIEQPTHRLLWAAARQAAGTAWDRDESVPAVEILRRAEQGAGVTIDDRDLRRQLVRLLDQILIPTVVAERILAVLERSGRLMGVIGAGWTRLGRTTQPDLGAMAEKVGERRPVAVFAGGAEPDWAMLFGGIAAGWPSAVWVPRGALRLPGDAPLSPERHYVAFSTRSELQALLDRPPRSPVVVDLPGYGERLRELLAELRDLAEE